MDLGIVRPNDATWWAMTRGPQPGFTDLRILPGSRIVYVANPASDLKAKFEEVAQGGFTPAFQTKIINCITLFHARHGIAIGLASVKSSGRRTFQKQYELMTDGRKTTQAGPGESNHNWGMAADLGFQNLRWMQSEGRVVENETAWFHRMDELTGNRKASSKFYASMRAVGIESGMFKGPDDDAPHLQNWDDSGVSAAKSLADQLTRSGTMKWSTAPKRYSCDLGLGGPLVHVGTSVEIWRGGASVSAAEITKLRRLQADREAKALAVAGSPPPKPRAVPAATGAEVKAMQAELRRQFELAEANWQNWLPIQR